MQIFLRTLLVIALLAAVVACQPASDSDGAPAPEAASAPAQEPSKLLDAAAAAAGVIDEDFLRTHIAAISDDAMGGRAPGTEGDLMARKYLAEQMAAVGLEPGGVDGTWEQPFDIMRVEYEVPKGWTFKGPNGEVTLERSEEFVAFPGVQSDVAAIEGAELVFVGYGIEAPEYQWDDFKGVDVAGKVLVMLNNDPDWDESIFDGDRRLYYGRWSYKYEQAAKHGAVGAIVHHTRPSAGYGWNVVASSWAGSQVELPAGDEKRIQVGGWTTEGATGKLMALAGQDWSALVEQAKTREFTPVPLGVTTSISLRSSLEKTTTANVIGRLPGGDPELADEVVLYGAHHDHLGIGEADDSGDKIFNGALDNAAGLSAMLGVAKAFGQLPEKPRRTILFATWAAEEQGLLGSKHFRTFPTVPAGRIAANINMDGGNIWGKAENVVFIGKGKSTLDAVVERHAAAQGRTVLADQFPDRGYYYRSDQFNLAKIGVPAVYLNTGTKFVGRDEGWAKEQIETWEANLYHQQGDELEDWWVFDGMIDDARLSFMIGLDVAETTAMPGWQPGDEFEAARKAALAALAN
ncbi:MAG: M28 family peptidase [Acidobacteriota bacterium]